MSEVDSVGEDPLSFNFWPAFADLMLALAFVLILVLFLVAFEMQAGAVGLAEIREKQIELVGRIAESVDGQVVQDSVGTDYGGRVEVCFGGECPIGVVNDIQLQRITFSDQLLFASGRHDLSIQGRAVLRQVGLAVRDKLGSLSKIQIEGHTDDRPAPQYAEGNLELGALRAIAVYRFLQREVEIDPAGSLMSATSFGEFSPVDRGDRGANRRVELLLFYNRPEAPVSR